MSRAEPARCCVARSQPRDKQAAWIWRWGLERQRLAVEGLPEPPRRRAQPPPLTPPPLPPSANMRKAFSLSFIQQLLIALGWCAPALGSSSLRCARARS